ncbi:class II aldolase/adducin family protein [Pseudomonas sp. dw_358]|uniref:class II aldolase/adducin family protein n=1 Tax=Pseudomonas sp. dw_358 TaxID=2720083 RepID=UPI001BD5F8C0|nr:class II aldolase/adducin family protein [Pseudomonas sp. dw_358]
MIKKQPEPQERQLRVELAAAFRMVAHLDWHEGVVNHFSVAVSEDGKQFLLNPKWRHFAGLCASDLLLLDADDSQVMARADAPDPTAWSIHGTLHARLPQLRCLLHLHPPYATALACLADPQIKAIDQTTARFHQRVVIDRYYSGMADDADEGLRLSRLLAQHPVLLMGNHGVLVAGPSVAEAFDTLYHLERACRTLMLAYASGQPLSLLPDHVAERTARDWEGFSESSFAHFAENRRLLDARHEDYAR